MLYSDYVHLLLKVRVDAELLKNQKTSLNTILGTGFKNILLTENHALNAEE